MSDWHELSQTQVMRQLESTEDGLGSEVVRARLKKHGRNELPRKQAAGWFIILLRQFKSPFMYILLFAAGVSLFFGDLVDAGVIAAAIVVNTLVGFIQEYRASRALEQLRSLVHPTATVIRNGQKESIGAELIVPGDVLVLEAGDRVAADARLIEVNSLETNEAALTGESLPITKDLLPLEKGTVLAERKNMVYAGTVVTNGRGLAIVTGTGLKTELGKIATLVKDTEDDETPLQVQLRRLAKILSIIFLAVSGLIFVIGVVGGRSVFEMFLTSIALAVAAVPEGLLVAVTVVLAIGMQRILKKKSLIRKLIATETLGSVSVICTDKTGTITQATMEATEVRLGGRTYTAEDLKRDQLNAEQTRLAQIVTLCNDASISKDQNGENIYLGSPTETALLKLTADIGFSIEQLAKNYPRITEIPFDSKFKYMATLNEWDGERAILVKGAPEKVLKFCSVDEAEVLREADKMTDRGLRVLAVAYKKVTLDQKELDHTDLAGLTFVGLFGLQDPIRPDAKETIAKARGAGVRTVIITGDHPDTAVAIAKQAGVETNRSRTITGAEMDGMSDQDLAGRIQDVDVFARVEPSHKVRIVKAWKDAGEVVSMTGDGVNDAPALKAADIGVALGNGTEVAKSTADMVLINNALTTIVAAIEQGRVIYDNIRKVTTYLLVDSFTEMVLIGTAIILGLPLPLLPAQILWINLITDGFPSVALTLEPGEPDVMKEPPRPRKEPILNREIKTIIFIIGLITDAVILGIFLYMLRESLSIEYIRSIIFTAVAIDSLAYVFAIKSFRHTIFGTHIFNNRWLILGVMAGFGLQVMAVSVPFFQRIFEITPLHLYDWLLLIMIGSVKLVMIEVVKWYFIVKKKRELKLNPT